MKITKLTVAQAKFIIKTIMECDADARKIKVSREDGEAKITIKGYSHNERDAYLTIQDDGTVTWEMGVSMGRLSSSGGEYDYRPINALPITDYLREQGYKFEYKPYK